ncbi:MAG: 30S ribosome-binding factor RbfA [Alphaproteobacteria bacterium]|nr:30S ribosome-binding factor RbfA [Alphaproteobacteria bacterium]
MVDRRHFQLAEIVKRTLCAFLQKYPLRHPAMSSVKVTISEVRLSKDFQWADVYVLNLFGSSVSKEVVLEALNNDKFFMRKHLARYGKLRKTPDLRFCYDESFDYAENIDALLDDCRES